MGSIPDVDDNNVDKPSFFGYCRATSNLSTKTHGLGMINNSAKVRYITSKMYIQVQRNSFGYSKVRKGPKGRVR